MDLGIARAKLSIGIPLQTRSYPEQAYFPYDPSARMPLLKKTRVGWYV